MSEDDTGRTAVQNLSANIRNVYLWIPQCLGT